MSIRQVSLVFRRLVTAPGAAATVAGVGLAVGGALAAVVLYRGALRGVPGRPGELIQIWDSRSSKSEPALDLAHVEVLVASAAAFDGVAAYASGMVPVEVPDSPAHRISAARISPNFFEVVPLALMRAAGIDSRGTEGGDGTWVVVGARFASITRLNIGDRIVVDGNSAVVVGIVESTTWFPDRDTQVWIPSLTTAHIPEVRAGSAPTRVLVQAVARLRPGATLAVARAEAAGLLGIPEEQVVMDAFDERLRKDAQPSLAGILLCAFLLLGVGAVNVTVLLGVRGTAGARSIWIRAALGASPARLASSLVLKSLVAGCLAAPVALGLGWAVLEVLDRTSGGTLSVLSDRTLTLDVTVAAILACPVLAAALGILPAVRITRACSLAPTARGVPDLDRSRPGVTIAIQVAMAVTLTVGAIHQARSVRFLGSHEYLGFEASTLIASQLLPRTPVDDPEAAAGELQWVVRNVVEHGPAAMVSYLPLGGMDRSMSVRLRGAEMQSQQVGLRLSTARYFDVMGVRFLAGGPFDDAAAQRQVVVNGALAELLYGTPDAVGRQLILGSVWAPEQQIVGVIQPLRHGGLFEPGRPELFLPYGNTDVLSSARQFFETAFIVLPTSHPMANLSSLSRMLSASSSRYKVARIDTMEALVGAASGLRPALVSAASLYGGIAMAVLVLGLYGTSARAVAARRQELAVRLALGSTPTRAAAGALRSVILGVGAGLTVSVVTTAAFTAVISALVVTPPGFPQGATVAAALVLTTALVGAVGLAATVFPAALAIRRDGHRPLVPADR